MYRNHRPTTQEQMQAKARRLRASRNAPAGFAPRAIAATVAMTLISVLVTSGASFAGSALSPATEEPFVLVSPAPRLGGSALVPETPDTVQDGATVYLNEAGPFASSPAGAGDPRMLGEQVTLVPNPPAPLQINSIEFALLVQTTTPLVAVVKVWDNYDPLATPVNTGLLRSQEFNLGTIPANLPGEFYPNLKVIFSTPVSLADTSVFIEVQFRVSSGGAFAPVQQIFALNATGPQVGSSTNDFFRDLAPADGSFSPSERRAFNAASCSPFPPGCQSNMWLHVRGAPNPNVVDPGMDLWKTPGSGASTITIPAGSPIPATFFDACAGPGQHSDPLSGAIAFGGSPLTTNPPGALGTTDTIVRRTGTANLPSAGSTASVPIEMVALSLVSVNPVTVTYNGGGSPQLWDVRAALSDSAHPAGSMAIVKGACTSEGGTFTATLPVLPKLIFIRRSDSCRVVLDYGLAGRPAITLGAGAGHWSTDAPGGMFLSDDYYGGVQVDGNGDGTFDSTPLPTTTPNFRGGVRVPRCGCCQEAPAVCGAPASPAGCSSGLHIAGSSCNGGSGACDAVCGPAGSQIARITRWAGTNGRLDLLPAGSLTADIDGDLVPDFGDNCAPPTGVVNPQQDDADDDGHGDACDNCRDLCNLDQADNDSDGAGDLCDCAPSNATIKTSPGKIASLVMTRTSTAGALSVSWSSLDPTAGTSTMYDAVRGRVNQLHGPGYPGGALCAAEGLGDTPYAELAAACGASVGDGCWYLVRAENGCGTGTYADASQTPPHPLDGASDPCP